MHGARSTAQQLQQARPGQATRLNSAVGACVRRGVGPAAGGERWSSWWRRGSPGIAPTRPRGSHCPAPAPSTPPLGGRERGCPLGLWAPDPRRLAHPQDRAAQRRVGGAARGGASPRTGRAVADRPARVRRPSGHGAAGVRRPRAQEQRREPRREQRREQHRSQPPTPRHGLTRDTAARRRRASAVAPPPRPGTLATLRPRPARRVRACVRRGGVTGI